MPTMGRRCLVSVRCGSSGVARVDELTKDLIAAQSRLECSCSILREYGTGKLILAATEIAREVAACLEIVAQELGGLLVKSARAKERSCG